MSGGADRAEAAPRLDAERASRFARLALAHVEREYPNKLDHVMRDSGDVLPPRTLHPVFYGSFDWHSCVHGYWLLATVRRRYAGVPEHAAITALFDRQLLPDKVAAEAEYAAPAVRAGFERPYGWAWLLMLTAELARDPSAEGRRWREALRPLETLFVRRMGEYLPKLTYAIRSGAHFNTAFAIHLALEYVAQVPQPELAALCRARARDWYGADRDYRGGEPSGDDFLSPGLMEAVCMRGVLGPAEFAAWRDAFLPDVSQGSPAALCTPAWVSDRSDGKIAHLDGLNLSRAWCWGELASTWPPGDARRAAAIHLQSIHLSASLPHVAGDYMGEHWLATFALLALDAVPPSA